VSEAHHGHFAQTTGQSLFPGRCALKNDPGMALIDPDKPWQNGTAESFNGKSKQRQSSSDGESITIMFDLIQVFRT